MEVVIDIAKDFILPIDFDSEVHDPTLENVAEMPANIKSPNQKVLYKLLTLKYLKLYIFDFFY